jgi:hypothetical protein
VSPLRTKGAVAIRVKWDLRHSSGNPALRGPAEPDNIFVERLWRSLKYGVTPPGTPLASSIVAA